MGAGKKFDIFYQVDNVSDNCSALKTVAYTAKVRKGNIFLFREADYCRYNGNDEKVKYHKISVHPASTERYQFTITQEISFVNAQHYRTRIERFARHPHGLTPISLETLPFSSVPPKQDRDGQSVFVGSFDCRYETPALGIFVTTLEDTYRPLVSSKFSWLAKEVCGFRFWFAVSSFKTPMSAIGHSIDFSVGGQGARTSAQIHQRLPPIPLSVLAVPQIENWLRRLYDLNICAKSNI